MASVRRAHHEIAPTSLSVLQLGDAYSKVSTLAFGRSRTKRINVISSSRRGLEHRPTAPPLIAFHLIHSFTETQSDFSGSSLLNLSFSGN